MNPCRNRRKQIAFLVINALDAAEAKPLSRHLEECNGCRQYHNEIRALTRRVNALPELAPGHDQPVEFSNSVVRTQSFGACRQSVHLPQLDMIWKRGLAVALCSLVFCAVVLMLPRSQRIAPKPLNARIGHPPAPTRAIDALSPSLAHYRAAGIRSLDLLDDLLLQQSHTNPGGPQCPTAGALEIPFLQD